MRILLISALLPLSLMAGPEEDYVNFIRQIQADGSGQWDLWDVDPTGAATSVEGVGPDGSDFELWSIHSPTGNSYALDSQFVAAYAPAAEITIETGDPYASVPRTRADKGFTAYVEINGLIAPKDIDASTPVAAQMVLYTHLAYAYPEGTNTLEGSAVTPTQVDQFYVTGNGFFPDDPGYLRFTVTNIPSTAITEVRGEEHFSITALADFGVPESELETTKVQVWPVASAALSGLDPSQNYKSLPPITIQLFDLYPSSLTWAQVYPTSDPTNVKVLGDTVFPWTAAVPTDREQLFPDLDELVDTHGQHVIEIIHETPWGQEILASASFTVDRRIEFKGNLTSM